MNKDYPFYAGAFELKQTFNLAEINNNGKYLQGLFYFSKTSIFNYLFYLAILPCQ